MRKITADDINLSGVDVMFEITRFCNMECLHCIRGDKQRLRIKKEYINSVLSQFDYISVLSITGGEPGLAIDLINFIRESARMHRVEVGNFWMATNGTIAKKSFFNAIENWFKFAEDGDINGLRISIDAYHDSINKWPWKEFEEELGYSLGKEISFEWQGAPQSDFLIGEGRAADNYRTTRRVSHDINLLDDGHVEGNLMVSAKGFVVSTCDISYETEDNNKEYTICHCTENIKEGLANFFNNHPNFVDQDFWKHKESDED